MKFTQEQLNALQLFNTSTYNGDNITKDGLNSLCFWISLSMQQPRWNRIKTIFLSSLTQCKDLVVTDNSVSVKNIATCDKNTAANALRKYLNQTEGYLYSSPYSYTNSSTPDYHNLLMPDNAPTSEGGWLGLSELLRTYSGYNFSTKLMGDSAQVAEDNLFKTHSSYISQGLMAKSLTIECNPSDPDDAVNSGKSWEERLMKTIALYNDIKTFVHTVRELRLRFS